MGKTGSGKTTILEAICGLRSVDGLRFLLDRDVTRLTPADRGVGEGLRRRTSPCFPP